MRIKKLFVILFIILLLVLNVLNVTAKTNEKKCKKLEKKYYDKFDCCNIDSKKCKKIKKKYEKKDCGILECLPDLIITDIEIEDKSTYDLITFTYKNIGYISTEGYSSMYTRFKLFGPTPLDIEFLDYSIYYPLEPGQTTGISYIINIDEGDYIVNAYVDSQDEIKEMDEGNNEFNNEISY